MQKLQDSVFSIVKTTNLSPGVFNFLQPSDDFTDKTPLGGILKDTKHGWLALGPKFCVIDLRTGLKVAARTFGSPLSNVRNISVTSVVELPTPLTDNSQQLVISLQCEESGMICVLHVNGSQLLHCIQTEVVVTELAVCDRIPDGPFTCFDGVVMAGTKSGEIFAFDLNRAGLLQALKDITQRYENLVQNEANPTNLSFLSLSAINRILEQRELALENDDRLAILLNENSLVDGQYIFRNPDGTVRMKAKRDHIRVTVLQYIPQLGSLAVGYNFGAFQIWNIMTLELEFTSQVNVECLPVTNFGFQEPCDDPRAFCYLWVVFSVTDRFEEEEFPLAVLYSLTYQGKRMLSDVKHLYQEFSTATIRFQLELGAADESPLLGGKCVSCHTYSVNSTLADEGEESMLNVCQIVWECWGENANASSQYGMLLFDLDQWYKDQMPATWRLESNAFMSVTWCSELAQGPCVTLDVRLDPSSVAMYSHATRLDEHFYPNSLQYNCICLNTSDACVLGTMGIQRQIISSLDEVGPAALLNPPRLYGACVSAGLTPLLADTYCTNIGQDEQRRFLLSVGLEARLTRFLKRCAHDWATGSHSGAGCTLTFLVDWCWQRAIELKEHAKELTAPLFTSSALPDRNVLRLLENCVQQLTQLTGLLDAVLTKCCNLIIPDALNEIEEKYKGMGTVSLYFQVVQWFVRVGLLPERHDKLPYPAAQLSATYNKRRMKLNRLQDTSFDENSSKSCALLYIDQLIENEFGGERIHQMWINGGSEWNGVYPPPSLYSLLRLYLLPDIPEEQKHSLVLYLLVDYSMVYDEVRYEAVIRRLMQFPTMFGLSNTAIKATQAFWHLDHRDFDFALDQLQCLTGNTLSEWQHNVVLSSLLAQKKTQAALQYLHVRKPAPIHVRDRDGDRNNCSMRIGDHDKLDDWQSSCNLYLARGLVFEALDVVRMCSQNAADVSDKLQVWNYFFKGCRNTGNLSKVLQVTLQPFEEEVFVRFLEGCNESQTSDILIMYYLQQARYLEAERYNNKLKQSKPRPKEISTSVESLFDIVDREGARDTIVEVMCSSLPPIANTVAHYAFDDREIEPHVLAPKPLSVFVQAKSPKNTFTYKSSFIQDTIENASETWMNRPRMRKGLKRALNIEDTPFICTPKLSKTRSIFSAEQSVSESTPPKRPKLDLTGTPKTPKMGSAFKVSEKLSTQMATLLDMPEVQSPDFKMYDRGGAETPHSILKTRRNEAMDAPSPVDSRYLGESDDELLETASNHTHYSDSTNKHLRFTIPTASEAESTPSPPATTIPPSERVDPVQDRERSISTVPEKEIEVSTDSFTTTESHTMNEPHPMESPPKKQATEDKVKTRLSFKDTVRARRSLSISANSSLSDDPNTSIESIADIPITLINPRYSGEKRHRHIEQAQSTIEVHSQTIGEDSVMEKDGDKTESEEKFEDSVKIEVPKTPQGRRSIRAISGESTPLVNRSRSATPERLGSPIVTPLRSSRATRSRSRTPELSPRSSPLAPIPEQPKQETESEPHPEKTTLSVPRQLRSRSRTPERTDKGVSESPRLEVITESPTKSSNTESSSSSPSRRSLRSRSRTPEVEIVLEQSVPVSPRGLRSRSKTPEKIMSPKIEHSARGKKSLSRLVLEANTFAKTKQNLEKLEAECTEQTGSVIECTPMKSLKPVPSLMDVTLSPIVNKSVLQSSTDSTSPENVEKDVKVTDKSTQDKSLPAFTTIHETYIEKSVLCSYESSVGETSSIQEEKVVVVEKKEASVLKPLPTFTLNDTELEKSVLHSYESSIAEVSSIEEESKIGRNLSKPFAAFAAMIENDFEKSVLRSCESSVGEISKEDNKTKDSEQASSLITNDSDVEMQAQAEDSQDTAAKKEKEKIVEIEREINEIEEDMSDSVGIDDSDSSGDEEIIAEVPISSEEDESEEENESSSVSSSGDEEIISIKDTDSDSSSDQRLQIDEKSSDTDNDSLPEPDNMVLVEVEEGLSELTNKQSEKGIEKDIEITEPTETSADPLNQAQFSLMTDDNSLVESDKSDLNLNYSEEKVDNVIVTGEKEAEPMEIEPQPAVIAEAPTETKIVVAKDVPKDVDAVDAAVKFCDDVVIKNTSGLEKVETKEANESKTQPESMKVEEQLTETKTAMTSKEIMHEPIVDKISARTKAKTPERSREKTPERTKATVSEQTKEKISEQAKEKSTEPTKEKMLESNNVMMPAPTKDNAPEPSLANIADQNNEKTPEPKDEKTLEPKEITPRESSEHTSEDTEKDEEKPRSRKRTKSISSNKSVKDTQEIEVRTPVTRKRTQSTSNKTEVEEKTPESDKTPETGTPTRRRAKTPTSAEVRKIITRRVSREMSEKLDDSKLLDESVLTPKRRSARTKSKNIDDNESVASESSVVSGRSKASEDAGDRPSQVRKGRKSVVATKPELSVIPEVTAEEGPKGESENVVEYSSSRRLTRHQKAVLEGSKGRRLSTTSRTSRSVVSEQGDDDDASSTHSSAFDVQPIDRISLLNKTDFEGSPDTDELRNLSPESLASDASKQRRARLGRAASESRSTPKAAKIGRRISTDIVGASPERGSPVPAGDSPSRGRRASFTRACEALHTPKGRRTSTDLRKGELDSPVESPGASESDPPATPSRRGRRASTQSNTSLARSDAGKRSRRTPSVDENKDSKKK